MEKILVKKTSTGLKVKIKGTEALDMSENMQAIITVKLSINCIDAVSLSLLGEFFLKQLNKKAFESEVVLKFSTAEAIAFWQVFNKSKIEILSDLCYWIADCLIKNGVCLYEKNRNQYQG